MYKKITNKLTEIKFLMSILVYMSCRQRMQINKYLNGNQFSKEKKKQKL